MTTVMLIMIAVGLLLILAALIYVGLTGYRLYTAITLAQATIQPPLDEIMKQQVKTTELLARIQARQNKIMDNIESISETAEDLDILQNELVDAVDSLSGKEAAGLD
jgi:predicted signal transduction protein with EAL and GGDEF domain